MHICTYVGMYIPKYVKRKSAHLFVRCINSETNCNKSYNISESIKNVININ